MKSASMLATAIALLLASPSAHAQNVAATLQQMIDQRLRMQVGDLTISNIVLGAQIETLQARIAELEKQLADAKAKRAEMDKHLGAEEP